MIFSLGANLGISNFHEWFMRLSRLSISTWPWAWLLVDMTYDKRRLWDLGKFIVLNSSGYCFNNMVLMVIDSVFSAGKQLYKKEKLGKIMNDLRIFLTYPLLLVDQAA